MSDTSAQPARVKKPAAKKAEHSTYAVMVAEAIVALKARRGSSKQAIVKYVQANNKVNDNCNNCVKGALKKGVICGSLTQVKGKGASGSFKVAVKPKALKKKKKTAKKSAPKKPAAKKPAAKKSAKRPAAKKPAAKKAAKKSAKKPAAKKPAAKKAAKKPAAKKPVPKKAKKAKK